MICMNGMIILWSLTSHVLTRRSEQVEFAVSPYNKTGSLKKTNLWSALMKLLLNNGVVITMNFPLNFMAPLQFLQEVLACLQAVVFVSFLFVFYRFFTSTTGVFFCKSWVRFGKVNSLELSSNENFFPSVLCMRLFYLKVSLD